MGTGSSGIGKAGVKKFTDTAEDGWDYFGDGEDTIEYFKKNSNYDSLIKKMTPDEANAFRRWCSGAFMGGEQYRGFDNMPGFMQNLTRVYDKFLDQAILKQSIEVRRLATAELVLGAGRKIPSLEALKAAEGSIVTSKGNMSTGAAAEGLEIGGRSKKVEYNFKIPGGKKGKGAGMWIGDSRINGWEAKQREFMMNRDTSYRVGKTTYDKKRKVYVVDMEFLGLGEHDYGSAGK